MPKNKDFFDRLVERVDQLDPASVQAFLLRLGRDKGLLETIFQTIREGVLILDRDLHIHYVNRAAMHLLGLPQDIRERREPRLNLYLRDLDWGHLLAQPPQEWERASRQELEIFYPEHRYLQFYLLPCPGDSPADPRQNLVAVVLRDITDLRVSAETTVETEKLKAITLLAGSVAHEIGNPLNSLMIHLQLLERQLRRPAGTAPEPDDPQSLLQVAMDEVRRLDTIIAQFLKAVRPSPVELAPLAITQVISDTLAAMKPEIENRGIAIEGAWSDDLPVVYGDAGQLKQAFYNVIKNALQAMAEGGMLKITAERAEPWLELHFADTGKGIPPHHLGQLFTPYYTTRSEGTGLGLVIIERIIRDHGGEIALNSSPGQGTDFVIKLPLRISRTRLLESPAPTAP